MNRNEFIGKLNALYVGDKNCLEELLTAYDEKDEEIERLKNILKIIKETVNDESNRYYDDDGGFCIVDGNYIEEILKEV